MIFANILIISCLIKQCKGLKFVNFSRSLKQQNLLNPVMTKVLPYYAVIFTSKHSNNLEGYHDMSQKMEQLAKQQNGFLGMESARDAIGITVSYWQSLEAIAQWKQQSEHLLAQQKGRTQWYDWYAVKICKVEREYAFTPSL